MFLEKGESANGLVVASNCQHLSADRSYAGIDGQFGCCRLSCETGHGNCFPKSNGSTKSSHKVE